MPKPDPRQDRLSRLSARWTTLFPDLPAPQIEALGKARIVRAPGGADPGFPDKIRPGEPPTERPTEPVPCPRSVAYRYIDFQSGQQARITLDGRAGLTALRDRSALRPGARVTPSSRAELELLFNDGAGPVLPSITGEDTRVRIQPTTVFPHSALVHIPETRSSGAMIGDDIVLTAAHCVSNGGHCEDPGYTEEIYEVSVIPGMDRNPDCSSGDDSDSCRTRPFGQIAVDAALVPEGWFTPRGADNCTGFQIYVADWWVDDIAVLFLAEPVGQQTGYFDYGAKTTGQLQNGAFLNRGYPAPNNQSPPGYEPWQMYGDSNYCFAVSFSGQVDGVHQLFRHGCDTSPGHSGSPIYQWILSLDQPPRPEIVGIVSHHSAPYNYAKRLTETDPLPAFAQIMGLTYG